MLLVGGIQWVRVTADVHEETSWKMAPAQESSELHCRLSQHRRRAKSGAFRWSLKPVVANECEELYDDSDVLKIDISIYVPPKSTSSGVNLARGRCSARFGPKSLHLSRFDIRKLLRHPRIPSKAVDFDVSELLELGYGVPRLVNENWIPLETSCAEAAPEVSARSPFEIQA